MKQLQAAHLQENLLDQDEGHPGLEALHDFLLANGLQGIDVDEDLNKHGIKKLLATMLQATQQILLGTPEQAVGLGEDVIENFRDQTYWYASQTHV